MGKTSIEWSHYTFNAWWGCLEVSPECNNCYARELDHRFPILGQTHWGKEAPRRFFGDAHWAEPLKWNRKAKRDGVRERVFSGSMCDICEDRRDLDEHRARLLSLIRDTPSLDWLLLTKRPQNYSRLFRGVALPPNVWAGTTVGVRASLWRIDALREVPAPVRFLSVEPLLENLGTLDLTGIHWVIVGGESGRQARPMHPEWARSIRDQCVAAGVPFHFKQWGEWGPGFLDRGDVGGLRHVGKKAAGRLLDGREWNELPREGGRER